MQKCADLLECRTMNANSQKSVSVQSRTSPPKFGKKSQHFENTLRSEKCIGAARHLHLVAIGSNLELCKGAGNKKTTNQDNV